MCIQYGVTFRCICAHVVCSLYSLLLAYIISQMQNVIHADIYCSFCILPFVVIAEYCTTRHLTAICSLCCHSSVIRTNHTGFSHTCLNSVFPAPTVVFDRLQGETTWFAEQRRMANRAFAVAAPSAWNCLPDNLRNCQTHTNFSSQLKTHFFNTVFYDYD